MKNTFILAIIFLFISHTLFSAHEFDQQLSLDGESGSVQLSLSIHESKKQRIAHKKNDSVQKRVYDVQLTAELEKLFKKTNDLSWSEDSLKMKDLIRRGADPNVRRYDSHLLSYACLYEDNKLINTCLVYGALTENIDTLKKTAIYNCKSVSDLELLEKYGAKFNYQSHRGTTAVHNAVERNCSVEVVEFFCSRIQPIYVEKTNTPLHWLCTKAHSKTDFSLKMALLLWWLSSQPGFKNSYGMLPVDYLIRDNSKYLSQFNMIKEGMKRVHAIWQDKQYRSMSEVKEILPGPIVDLVYSYLFDSYTSLRSVIQTEEKMRQECPEIAKLFAPTKYIKDR